MQRLQPEGGVRTFRALRVEESVAGEDAKYTATVKERSTDDLPEGELLIRVQYSSVNYKDALSARGNRGVTRSYPHTPGIDAAGIVVASDNEDFAVGDEVIVIGFDLGMDTAGGFGQYISVPAEWAVCLPEGLSLRESMVIGTAGFTAALSVDKLLQNGLGPEQGQVLVTGATGGVGSYAVALLASLGYEVCALTGKSSAHDFLKQLGAAQVMEREALAESSGRPLLKEQWAGAVDVVGGSILFNVIKSLKYGGSVACCGLVGAPDFNATVFPFILRGVNLLGVDSVNLPIERKHDVWNELAGDWKIANLNNLASEVSFDGLPEALDNIYRGRAVGRTVLKL